MREDQHFGAGVDQLRLQARHESARAEAVCHDAYAHTATRRLAQRRTDATTGRVRLEDVGLQVNVILRVGNGLQQRREKLRAVLQQDDAIAGQQWTHVRFTLLFVLSTSSVVKAA